ncbi:MAG: hypothetical protein OEO77_07420 [Acidimicrobiia bacterium]|nr:hypothetical protein [Acidimicrobiia bacterium]
MLITDTLLLISLLAFCSAWFWRTLRPRESVLWGAAAAAAALALLGVLDGRWQGAVGLAAAVIFLLVLAIRRLRESRPRNRIPVISGAAFVLLTGLAFVPLYSVPVFSLPAPEGPHVVGVRDFELTDHSRLGVLYAAENEPRRLAVRVWYPASTTDGYTVRPYATEAEIETTFAAIATEEFGMPSFFFSHLRGVATHSYLDAPVLDGGEPLPVVFFNHGLNGYLSQNSVLMEHLASNGYVVFSIAHPYDAAPIVFGNGDVVRLPPEEVKNRAEGVEQPDEIKNLVVEAEPKRMQGSTYQDRFEGAIGILRMFNMIDDRIYDESPRVWVDDVLFVEEALASGQAPPAIADILGQADLTRVGHLGHSYGGATAAAIAYEDPRAGSAVNLDGSNDRNSGWNADVPVPFMMIYSDSTNAWGSVEGPPVRPVGFNDFVYERYETVGLRDDITRLHVMGTNHFGVTDAKLMTRGPVHTSLTGRLEAQRTLDILNLFICDFFDTHLRGEAKGFPEAQFAAYPGDVVSHDVSGIRQWWLSKTPAERAELEHALAQAKT